MWKVSRVVEFKVLGSTRGLLLVACLLGLVLGCSRGRQHPPTHAVTGLVTVDGKPVTDAIVSFLPANGQYPANGTTDASGRYELTSFTRGDGAMEGSLRVTIVKYEKDNGDIPDGNPGGNVDQSAAEGNEQETGNEGYVPAGMVVSQYDEGPKNLLPKQYSDQQETPLTAEVKADQNSIDFDLSK